MRLHDITIIISIAMLAITIMVLASKEPASPPAPPSGLTVTPLEVR